jgi:hypothetical protein
VEPFKTNLDFIKESVLLFKSEVNMEGPFEREIWRTEIEDEKESGQGGINEVYRIGKTLGK